MSGRWRRGIAVPDAVPDAVPGTGMWLIGAGATRFAGMRAA